MITKERLQELIEQGATIWTVNGSGNINPVKTNKTCEIQRQYLMKEGQIYSYIEQTFETKEEAEWHREFGNITRIERLELPTWEDFEKKDYFEFVAKKGTALILEKTLVIDFGKNPIVDYDLNILIKNDYNHTSMFRAEYTKENYTLACRKCKELFLGEKE